MTKRLVLLAVAAHLVALGAPAQPTPQDPAFVDSVSVELVLVDVVAEDRRGAPVLDLDRDELRVYQDGREVEVRHFTAPGRGATDEPDAAAASPRTARTTGAGRQVVIFLDQLHLQPNSRRRVLRTLAERLEDHLDDRDRVMMVAYGGTTEVLLPMTRDHRAVLRVLREQSEINATSLLVGNDDREVLDLLAQLRAMTADMGGGPDGGDTACRDMGHIAHSHALQIHGRVLSTIDELERFVNSLAGYAGRKMLLHVSDGIPMVAGAEAYRYASELCDGTGVGKGVPNAIDTASTGGLRNNYWDPTRTSATLREFDTSDEWSRLAAHANTYQVSFYTFQAAQPSNRSAGVGDTRTSFDVETAGERNRQDALFLLADETGGVALLGSNDVEPALTRLAADARHAYQLAYEPPTPGDGRQHAIRVEVERPGVRLRYRKSYQGKRPDERVTDRIVSALLHGREENPLAVEVDLSDRQPAEDDTTRVLVQIRVPLQRLVLLPEGTLRRGLFTVFIAARNEHGLVTPVGRKTVPLRVPLESGEEAFVYTVELPMHGSAGDVAVAVHDQIGGEISYLREHLRL